MEFFTDPRIFMPLVMGLLGAVGVFAANEASVKKLAKEVEVVKDKDLAEVRREIGRVASDCNRNAIDIAKLQSDHKTHGDKLNDVVTQLRQVVRDLQDVAIKLASEGHGKA